MVPGESFHEFSGLIDLAVQEDPLGRHENVLEHRHNFLTAETRVPDVLIGLLELAGVARLPAVNVADTFSVGRHGAAYGPILFALSHGQGRHDHDLVRVQHTGLVEFGTTYHDPVVLAFHDAQEQVRVRLILWPLASVALGIGHRTVHDQVLRLDPGPVIAEPPMIVGSVRLVALVGHAEYGVRRIPPDAPLKTAACHLAAHPLHPHLVDEIVGALVKMREPVDLFAGQR